MYKYQVKIYSNAPLKVQQKNVLVEISGKIRKNVIIDVNIPYTSLA